MNRNLLLLSLVILTYSLTSSAAKYGMGGCGMGSLIFEDKGGVIGQSSAHTTNGTSSWHQSFAISSGTSNCIPSDKSFGYIEQENFIASNYATLSKEMAQGQGQSLVELSKLMGCSENAQIAFQQFAQENYSKIFAVPGIVATTQMLREEIKTNSALAQSCNRI